MITIRNNRPLPESVQFTRSKFEKIWIADGSTLEALFRKLKSLEAIKSGSLAGKMGVVIDLYQKRWRIEDAFNTVKRLLGLSYIWTGSINGIKLKIWATWLFYAVLVDFGDAVADEIALPLDRISLEMIYRGLYYFHSASSRG